MYLRDPLTYPNWMWMVAIILIVLAIATIVVALGIANPKRRSRGEKVHPLTATRRRRYHGFLAEIEQRYTTGDLSEVEAQLALAALVRSAASERVRSDLEALTAAEAASRFPYWPSLQAALQWYEAQVFTGTQAIPAPSGSAAPDNAVISSIGNAVDHPASPPSTASADTGAGGVSASADGAVTGIGGAGTEPNPEIQQGVFLAKAVIDQ